MLAGEDADPLNIGRTSRRATARIRQAVEERDRGCSFPGCMEDPERCSLHHVRSWVDGGETSVHNMTLLCETHHSIVHLSAWEARMVLGEPAFLPPAYVDRERRPRFNILKRPWWTHPHLWPPTGRG